MLLQPACGSCVHNLVGICKLHYANVDKQKGLIVDFDITPPCADPESFFRGGPTFFFS